MCQTLWHHYCNERRNASQFWDHFYGPSDLLCIAHIIVLSYFMIIRTCAPLWRPNVDVPMISRFCVIPYSWCTRSCPLQNVSSAVLLRLLLFGGTWSVHDCKAPKFCEGLRRHDTCSREVTALSHPLNMSEARCLFGSKKEVLVFIGVLFSFSRLYRWQSTVFSHCKIKPSAATETNFRIRLFCNSP